MHSSREDIVIFTNGNLFSRIILDDFINKYDRRILKVVIITGDYKGNKGIIALMKYFANTTIAFSVYKLFTLLLIKILRGANSELITSVEQLCAKHQLDYISVHDINDSGCLFSWIRARKPKYLISVSCPQLIRKKWLELFDGKGINIHSSLLPEYAGLAPYFWVLANNENKTGITIHYLANRFDAGNVLCQEKVPIHEKTSCFSLFVNQCEVGRKLLPIAFSQMEEGHSGVEQDLKNLTYYSSPSTKAYLKLRLNGYYLFKTSDYRFIKQHLKLTTLNGL